HLVSLNPKTGRVIWKVERSGAQSPIASEKGMLFLQMKSGAVSAFDLHTRKTIWTTALGKPDPKQMKDGDLSAIVADGGCVAVNSDSKTYSLDAKTGKLLWKQDESYVFTRSLNALSGV